MIAPTSPRDIPTSDDRPIWDVWLSSVWLPSLSAAVELSIFEALFSGPADADELARKLGLRPRRCEILLRMHVSLGYLMLHAGRYQLTDVARLYLLRESPYYWGHVWSGMPDNPMHRRLLEAVRVPSSEVSEAHDATPAQAWESGQLDAQLAATIARFMNSHSMAAATGLARNGDFRAAKRLLDVGGGSGCFAIALAQHLPNLRCTVMDLPAMCRLAEDYIAQGGVAGRVDTIGVDMFRQKWPSGYDALFFSNIFHDWSLETCAELAATAHAALPKDGHIFLHEMLLDDTGCGPRAAAAFSVMMLFGTKGQQFTFSELQSLLEGAGFVDVAVTPTYGYYSLVRARAP